MYITIVLLAIMGLISTDIFVPSLPSIAEAFHQSSNHTQLTISIFLAGFSFSQLFYGPISDAIGRKTPLIFGVLFFIIGSYICISTDSFTWLCIGRLIQGIGVGAGLSLSRVILRDCYVGTELAIKTAHVAIMVSLTPALAPVLGGFLQQHFGFHSCFYFMLSYGAMLLLLLIFFKETLQEKNKQLNISTIFTQYKQLFCNHVFIKYTFISGIAFGSLIIYANVLPFIIQNELNMSAKENGLFMMIAALGISFASLCSSQLVKYIHPKQLISTGLIILFTAGLLLLITHYYVGTSLVAFIPLLFLVTMACGFIFPNAIAVSFSEVNCNIGVAGAVYGSTQIFISMLINFLLNTINHQDENLLGIFYLLIGLSGLILLFKNSLSRKVNYN